VRNRGKKYAIAWAKSCGDASQCDPITGVEFRFIAQICVVHTDGKNEKPQQIIPIESECKRESGWRCRKKKRKKNRINFAYSRILIVVWTYDGIYRIFMHGMYAARRRAFWSMRVLWPTMHMADDMIQSRGNVTRQYSSRLERQQRCALNAISLFFREKKVDINFLIILFPSINVNLSRLEYRIFDIAILSGVCLRGVCVKVSWSEH